MTSSQRPTCRLNFLGVIPTNAGGFGDVGKARDVFYENEVGSLIAWMLGLNHAFGARCSALKVSRSERGVHWLPFIDQIYALGCW